MMLVWIYADLKIMIYTLFTRILNATFIYVIAECFFLKFNQMKMLDNLECMLCIMYITNVKF